MNYESALSYATEMHKGQKRKEGIDYITHPIAVAELLLKKGFGIEYRIAGLFHDLLEDTDASYEDILKLSNKRIADAVVLLTKTDGYVMEDYIEGIRKKHISHMVKLADRVHNLRCAKYCSLKFCLKYIKETEDYFLKLAEGTVFEKDIREELDSVKVLCKTL